MKKISVRIKPQENEMDCARDPRVITRIIQIK